MSKATFEEIIEKEGRLVYTNVGDSMYPLIKPRDLLVIRKPPRPLRRLDIPLYKRDNGQYVLHRIVKKRANDYALCGDNRAGIETGITDRHIIGVLTEIVRDGSTFSVYSVKYRLYAHLWSDFMPIKRVIFKLRKIIKHRKKR